MIMISDCVALVAQEQPQIVPTRCSCLHHQIPQETQLALGFVGLSVGDKDLDFLVFLV